MQSALRWWQQIETRYSYRVPTAIACTVALLVAIGSWAVTTDGEGRTALVAGDGSEWQGDDGGEGSDTGSTPYGAGDPLTGADLPDGDDLEAAPGAGGAAGTSTATRGQTGGGADTGGGGTGGDGGGSGGTTGPAPACPEGLDKGGCTGVTANRVRLGIHTPTTQCGVPLPDTTDENEAEIEDYIEYVNRIEGGVHGRLIEYYTADDGYCTNMAGQAARELIDDHRVFSVQGFLGVDQIRTVAEHAQNRGVPYLAGGGPREWGQRWSVFHQSQSSYDVMYPAVLRYIIGSGGLNKPNARIGMMYVNTPDVRDPVVRSFQAVPQANVVEKIPLSQGIKQDFTEEIRRMQAAEVEVVYCNCHPLNMVSFVQQADAQLFRPQYTFVSQGYDLDIVLRLFPGDSTWARNAKGLSNFCHPSHPCAAPWETKLKQVRPNVRMSQVALVGIHAVEMWAEPMRRVGRDLNRQRYTQALQGLDGWSSGITGPVHLAPDRSAGAQGFTVYQSPGPGSRSYQMVDVGGQTFRSSW